MAAKMSLIENAPQAVDSCPSTSSVFILGRNAEKQTAVFFNPACGTWSCPICGQIKADEWQHQAARGAMVLQQDGYDLQFITLTSRGYATPNKSLHFFKENWPRLRKRARHATNVYFEETGRKFAYFMVPERHKSGVLHAHMVAATHIQSKNWWKRAAWETGFGYIIDVQKLVDPLIVAAYISKYLTKQVADTHWPRHFRHVRHSQNWPKSKPEEIKGWEWERYTCRDQAKIDLMDLQVSGWKLIDKARKDEI